jgi:hypothetical protein
MRKVSVGLKYFAEFSNPGPRTGVSLGSAIGTD